MCRLADDLGLALHQPPEVEALDADVAADEERRIDRLPEPAGKADRDGGSERAQELDRVREQLPADLVEDDVDRLDRVELVLGDRLPRTERER